MYDREMLLEILKQILDAVQKILKRAEPVRYVDYFTNTPEGMEKLDAICMLLIAIGESLKKIDKITKNKLLPLYSEIDWKGAKGMRDIISHHYFDVDAEQIFWVCKKQMQPLAKTIETIIGDLENKTRK